ncbi:12745_t:CDS:1, partial [Cetraspora pellucida]
MHLQTCDTVHLLLIIPRTNLLYPLSLIQKATSTHTTFTDYFNNIYFKNINEFGNHLTINSKAASILKITNPINKSYESIIKRYEILTTSNKWFNQNGPICPVSKQSLINYIKFLYTSVSPSTIATYLSAL